MKKVLTILFLLFSAQTFAGSNVAYLVCKSASGRTLFKAELQDILSFESGTFTIDGKSISYGTQPCSSIIFSAKNKIFTLRLQSESSEGGWLTFYAIPSSIKKLKVGNMTNIINLKQSFKVKILDQINTTHPK